MTTRPATAVGKMHPIRGHTASGLKQDLTVRVYAPAPESPSGSGCVEIDGHTFRFSSLAEARAMLDEYLRDAFQRAADGNPPPTH
jgi:hypothetical protein